jgi:hypothetical protein
LARWASGAAIFHRGTAMFGLINLVTEKSPTEAIRTNVSGCPTRCRKAGRLESLTNLIPASRQSAIILITAQDMFFAAAELGGIADSARDFQQAGANINGMTGNRDLKEPKVVRRRCLSRDDPTENPRHF